jgi:hypothetical protein
MKIQRRKCCLRLNPYPKFLPPLEAAALMIDLPYEILCCRQYLKITLSGSKGKRIIHLRLFAPSAIM